MLQNNQLLNRKEKRKIKTRERIINSAFTVFKKKGYTRTTISDIMDEADLDTALFTNTFITRTRFSSLL